MVVKLSSKGQMIIPKEIRQALSLKAGTELEVTLVNNQIVVSPVVDRKATIETIEALYGIFSELDLLGDLEEERRQKIELLFRESN